MHFVVGSIWACLVWRWFLLLCNINLPIWQWMLNHFFKDEEAVSNRTGFMGGCWEYNVSNKRVLRKLETKRTLTFKIRKRRLGEFNSQEIQSRMDRGNQLVTCLTNLHEWRVEWVCGMVKSQTLLRTTRIKSCAEPWTHPFP